MKTTTLLAIATAAASSTSAIIQSNDDGWAEANIRTLHDRLTTAGHNVILSAPADNRSGSSSLDLPALPRLTPCQFSSCPAPGPAVATSPTNPRLQYVNSFPVTALKAGLATLAPRFFNATLPPHLAVTGPNVGSNLDIQVPFSGTVGAAVEAVHRSIPAVAFSGASGEPVSFETRPTPRYAEIYAALAVELVEALAAAAAAAAGGDGEAPLLPPGVWLNVNVPTVGDGRCGRVAEFAFVLTRINAPGLLSGRDVDTCGNGGRLPTERSVVGRRDGCFVAVSVGDAADKTTAGRERQREVLERLGALVSCLP